MANVPYEASEIERFTPACLADIENPPVFRLKAASRRDRKRYELLIGEEGLRYHDAQAIRDEMLRGLQDLWSPDDYERIEPLLREYWQAKDEWREANADKAEADVEPFLFDAFSEDDARELTNRITEAWSPLRRLASQNSLFVRESPKLIASLVISGWSGIAVAFAKQEGIIPLETIDEIAQTLNEMEEAATGVVVGAAYSQLMLACSRRLFLSGQAEKNSSSPPPSSTNPPSTNSGTVSVDGSSKASASSIETPAA